MKGFSFRLTNEFIFSSGSMAPPACKNGPKKDGRRAQRLICYVSWPPLSEVSGSATDFNVRIPFM